ncbi:hypothetical protein ABEB36_001956 [Hypothenemus hampei]|uniref:Cathepsin propeptide inhibitor domain-containing protein n=1 Tax=Hypothenemus hampei TaxID=57062 RepID=A0ABD1FHD2_HYPHA
MSLLVGPVDVQEQWIDWKEKFSKSYDNEEEEEKRFQIFERNLQNIIKHNERYQAGEETSTQALNQFSDLDPEEVPKGGLRYVSRR